MPSQTHIDRFPGGEWTYCQQMWFVFPQIGVLGRSPIAQAYAITDLCKAQDYFAHPVLGPRLIECADIVAAHRGFSAEQIFGGIDAIKLRSSMTPFTHADPHQAVFRQDIHQYFRPLGLRPP